jgi:hypothetical protein
MICATMKRSRDNGHETNGHEYRQDNDYYKKKEKKTHSTYTYNQDRSNTTLNIRKMRCDSTNGQKRETYA